MLFLEFDMSSNPANSILVTQLNNSNDAAFQALYHEYHNAVLANILRLVDRQDEAEDILQEVFLALWESRHKLTPQHSVAGWLFTTSYYKASAYLKRSLKLAVSALPETYHEIPDEAAGAEGLFSERLTILHEAIEMLPPRKRTAFQLCRLEGRSYEEVAAILGITSESVKDYVKTSSIFIKRRILAGDAAIPFVGVYLVSLYFQV